MGSLAVTTALAEMSKLRTLCWRSFSIEQIATIALVEMSKLRPLCWRSFNSEQIATTLSKTIHLCPQA